ncbi:ADP-ribose pyrophosphatase YjhB, NUDIX family [Nonomuraea wenchangensis]|uniref:ADP-ribose pyrophosphatase YjhB, NUDIX family n=1 Tax=Nonomuraea wenchangensis TaxID=568860 RepID=A0A1I0LHE1_9ACTN|nr:ADP-ribose pyrophosphatase YjhB, NUDIX family [Nonomuraea wenchangensis]
MGFDGFLVPDWAKPYVGFAVGTDWPEGDEDGCFRLADACAYTAGAVMEEELLQTFGRPGEDWDGDALMELVERVQYVFDPTLKELIEQLVSAAKYYNNLGVQVQYTKRMIEVSVWFLIVQIGWLLAASMGPWGAMSLATIGARVQLTRLAIAQLARRLLINIGLFGGLMAGMDVAVQASQSRRDHLDWEQVLKSGGTGALLGTFLTGFTGLLPARSMAGLMLRSGFASAGTDFTVQLASGQFDPIRFIKSFTSGVVGGADAHWASWSPYASAKPGTRHGSPAVTDNPLWSSRTKSHSSPPSTVSLPITAHTTLSGSTPHALPNQTPGPFRILDNPGRSGDGYVQGGLWGRYGAAGVLIRSTDGPGQARYLLMQQSQNVSNAGKWQLPGGALDSLETPVNGAARELGEELGVGQSYLDQLQLKGEHAVEVGNNGWKYTNLAADGPMFTPRLDTFEASAARWFTLPEIAQMANHQELHPALAKALPDILDLYHDTPATPPPKDHYVATGTERRFKPPVDFSTYSGLSTDGPSPPLQQTIRRTETGLYYSAPAPHIPLDAPFGARLVHPSFGETVWQPVLKDLSGSELDVVRHYAGNGYIEMNGRLRGGEDPLLYPEGRVERKIELLNDVLRRQTVPETIDVYRVVRLTNKLFTVPVHELPGTVQRDPGFFSTNIGTEPIFGGDVVLHLRVPPDTPALYVKPISNLPENELLLGSGVSWFAEDVRRVYGKWHVYGWVLPDDAGP